MNGRVYSILCLTVDCIVKAAIVLAGSVLCCYSVLLALSKENKVL